MFVLHVLRAGTAKVDKMKRNGEAPSQFHNLPQYYLLSLYLPCHLKTNTSFSLPNQLRYLPGRTL